MQVTHLRPLRLLHTLWLLDNPVASRPNYRASVLSRLPQLQFSPSLLSSKQQYLPCRD